MAQRETWLQTDLKKPAQVQVLRGVMFSQDNQADLVGVNVYDNGQPAQLSGTVLGYIVKDNGDTVTITGTLQDNRAWIVLPANAYDVVGMIHIAIQLKANSTQTSPILTLGMCAVYVQRTQTGDIVTPEYRILDVAAILEMIDDVNAATAAATAAAGNANTKAGLADTAATRADAAAAALENMDASASTLTPGSDATAQVTTVSGHYRLNLGVPKGDTGATGPAPQITQTVTTYQESSSGSTIPSGTWQNAIPNPLTQGMFLWIKTVITYDTGDTLTQYSVSHQGLDGTGSVNSVDGVSPDANGNVTLPKDSAPTQASTNLITSGAVYAADAAQDTQIAALKNDLGIVEDGDTATHTIAQGQYVIWQGALYTADAAIASGTTLAASGGNKNLTAVENGGLNALNSNMTMLRNDLGVDAVVGQTYDIGNQNTCILSYGWSGLKAIGKIVIGATNNSNPVFLPKGSYSISIKNNACRAKKTESSDLTSIVSYISSISYNPVEKKIGFNFSSAPFGTSDSLIIVMFDGLITRNS